MASSLARTSSDVTRRLLAWGVLGYALFLGFRDYITQIRAGGEVWRSGDWLINYGGGFVRRGLLGELILRITPAKVPATLWAVFTVQSVCYAILIAYFLRFLRHANYSWGAVALACSPAGIAFMGWDPQGGFRKEIIGLAALALLAWNSHAAGSRRHARYRLVSAVILMTVGAFSWEATAVLLPAMWFLLMRSHHPAKRGRVGAGLIATVLVVTATALASRFHGDDAHVVDACSRLVDRGFDMAYCGFNTPITALSWSLQSNIDTVRASLPMTLWYLPLMALAALPLMSSTWVRHHKATALAIVLPVFVLYAIAIDFGRWTHLWFTALAIVVMSQRGSFARGWNVVSVALYVSLWGIPHCIIPEFTPQWPWLGLLHSAIAFDPVQRILGA